MVQTKLLKLNATIGEEIGLELGAQLVSSYNAANPTDAAPYFIGRNILDQLLAQPGCVGIKFYNAYNEAGEKTLVYIGVNADGNDMLSFTTISTEGILEEQKGIVADRTIRFPPSITEEENWWEL